MSSTAAAASSASPTTSTASPELGLDAGPEHRVVLDQEDPGPARSVGGVDCCPGRAHLTRSRRGMDSWTSAPSPGAERMTADAAEAGHAGADGLGDALAVLGHRVGVEAPAPVAHVEHDRVGLDLGVERDLVGPGPLGRVHGGLAGRIEQRAQRLVELAVPHHDHLHGDAVVGLDLALQQRRRPRPAWWRPRRWRPVAGPRTARPAARAPGPGPGAPRSGGRRRSAG